VTRDEPPRRIVSLVPSLTEWLFAIGTGERIVGVTRYCTDPPDGVKPLTKVGGTKNPDLAVIARLAPDLVVMNAEENRREDFDRLVEGGVRVLVTEPKTVEDAFVELARLATAVGREDEGRALTVTQAARVQAIRGATASRRPVRYFCPIWRKPWMGFNADTYAHDVLQVAGGENVLADRPARYPTIELDAVAALAPEVVLLPDEPYPFGARDVPALAPVMGAARLTERVHLVDGKALAWYGPRIADGVTRFAELFAAVRGAS
jgi:ABC-type Fe3+-hydroxamate transport system substrate-binding protein